VKTAVTTRNELADLLLRARNADGGWGYYAGKKSRLEPTCWAVLALRGQAASVDAAALRTWPSAEGLLLERHDGAPNYAFHALALLTLHACGAEHASGNATLAAAMQRAQGLTFEDSPYFRQNNKLVGWSWVAGTFGWVEPTAWCLLALKKWARVPGALADAGRIDQAERLLLDRICKPAGWNYGNSNALGQDLQPYVPTTAVAMLAMQDRQSDPAIERSVQFLEEQALSERSGSSLSLAAQALAVYQRPETAAAVRTALLEQLPVTMALGNHAVLASALCALQPDEANVAFRL
jgi:hypothetical protein